MPRAILQELLPQLVPILREETQIQRRRGGDRLRLGQAHFLDRSLRGWLYEFRVHDSIRAPDASRVWLESGETSVPGSIVTTDDFELVLELEERLEAPPRRAVLRIEEWHLLDALQRRLEAMAAAEGLSGSGRPLRAIGVSWVLTTAPLRRGPRPRFDEHQSLAIDQALSNPATFLWGGPGTGKTTVLARLVREASDQGQRVLIIADHNTSLDAAMLAITHQLEAGGRAGYALRLGTTPDTEVRRHPWLTAEAILPSAEPDLMERLDRCRSALATHRAGTPELDRARQELRAVAHQVAAWERELAASRQILGATLARVLLDGFFLGMRADLVILEDADAVPVPFALLAAAMADQHFVACGDLRGRPPSTISRTDAARRWLESHLFDHAGVGRAVRYGRPERRLVTLQRQYRMHPRISRVLSRALYSGHLLEGIGVEGATIPIAQRPPSPRDAVVVVDTHPLSPIGLWSRPRPGQSRLNPIHAIVDVLLAAGALPHHSSIAILTPFRAQAHLLRLLVEELGWRDTVRVSTVGGNRGSGVDMVVLDLVCAPPQRPLGPLLTGDAWSLAGHVFNLALGQARGKLIVVADQAWLRGASRPPDILSDLFYQLGQEGRPSFLTYEALAEQLEQVGLLEVVDVRHGPVLEVATPAAASRELRIGLATALLPPRWLREAGEQGTSILVHGAEVPREWHTIPGSLVAGTRLSFNVVIRDREELWLQLPQPGWTLHVDLPSVTLHLGQLMGLVPEDESCLVPTPREREWGPLSPPCTRCGGALWVIEGPAGLEPRCVAEGCGEPEAWSVETAAQHLTTVRATCERCGAPPRVRAGYGGLLVRCSRSGCDWWRPFADYL
jgi:hypothetical protein